MAMSMLFFGTLLSNGYIFPFLLYFSLPFFSQLLLLLLLLLLSHFSHV